MEIVIIIMLVILLFMDGYIIYSDIKSKIPEIKPMKPKLTKEEKDKQKMLRESFDNLMKYDEITARKRK